MLGEPESVSVKTSQSVPSTQVVSSVVAPATPLPAQVVEEPLAGLKVPDEGFDAKAGKTSTQHRDRRNIDFSFQFEGVTLLGSGAEIDGHKGTSPSRFLIGWETALSFALQNPGNT